MDFDDKWLVVTIISGLSLVVLFRLISFVDYRLVRASHQLVDHNLL